MFDYYQALKTRQQQLMNGPDSIYITDPIVYCNCVYVHFFPLLNTFTHLFKDFDLLGMYFSKLICHLNVFPSMVLQIFH